MNRRSCAALAFGLLLGILVPAGLTATAQGMISVDEPSDLDFGGLADIEAKEVPTIQRLLRRLGYLSDADMTRKLDSRTLMVLLAYFLDVNLKPPVTGEKVVHSLFTTAWSKEGWGSGTVSGQELVVDPAEVRAAQEALQQLGYVPGPIDGVFGPATLSAVEIFQEDHGMKATGLLTRNSFQSILRRLALRGQVPRGTIRVLNWPDYIDPEVLIQFEKKTKIEVVHEVFESSDETADLLMAGSPDYDVMVQTNTKLKMLVDDGGALLQLDRAKLPNSRHLDPRVLRYTAVLDPENKHTVPYMWGTVGIAVNETKVKPIRPNLALSSMALLLDPDIAADLSKCGLAFIDEPADVFPLLIAHLGGNFSKIQSVDLQMVEQALSKVASYVNVVSADRIIDDLSEGKYCVAVGYSGDAFVARDSAEAAGVGKISYHVPSTGGLLWFDHIVIPRNARNVEGAYELIDFLLRPEIAADNTNYLQYANPNLASKPFIEPALLNDPGLYPPTSVMRKLAVIPPLPNAINAEFDRIWSMLRRE